MAFDIVVLSMALILVVWTGGELATADSQDDRLDSLFRFLLISGPILRVALCLASGG